MPIPHCSQPTAHSSQLMPFSPPYDLTHWRGTIPLLQSMTPMNNCSQAPQTTATRQAADGYLDSWNTQGMDWDAWMEEVEQARGEFARLINAPVEQVAVSTSVSAAVSSLVSALTFDDRWAIVSSEAEFPTVGHVLLAQERRGADVRWAPVVDGAVDPESYHTLVDDDTLLVSATHAYYENGFKQDLGPITEMAHDRGALVLVDAYQTLGTEPVDVKALDVDFLAGGCLKYLMGIPGIAFLYVRGELIERLEPTVTGWFGRRDPFAFETKRLDWSDSASRFDTGTPTIISAAVARAGLEIINAVGPTDIEEWTEHLSHRLIEGGRHRGLALASPADPSGKSPTTAFWMPVDSHAVETAMRARSVLPSARGTLIRLAPHFYNTTDDVDTALDVLVTVLDDMAPWWRDHR